MEELVLFRAPLLEFFLFKMKAVILGSHLLQQLFYFGGLMGFVVFAF